MLRLVMINQSDLATATHVEQRIDTLDVLRGVAICGILLMNITAMGTVLDIEGLHYPAHWNAEWIAWAVRNALFEGTMRGLFTMLFGAGMLLMLRRAEDAQPQVTSFDVWSRRCLALMALGIVQFALFLWPGEILFTYGVSGLALLAFRTARTRTLLIVSAVMFVAMGTYLASNGVVRAQRNAVSLTAAASKAVGRPVTTEQRAALDGVKQAQDSLHPNPAEIAQEVAKRTRYTSLFWWSLDEWQNNILSTNGWRDVFESVTFMLIGMALYRTGILTGAASAATYRRLMLWGYITGLMIRLANIGYNAQSGFDFDVHRTSLLSAAVFPIAYEPARLAITLGHIGLIVFLFKAGLLGRAWPLRALGRMALTVYSLQSILTSILFYGLGYLNTFSFIPLLGIVAAVWFITGVLCVTWLRSHATGPAEWILRAIAYQSVRGRWRRGSVATQS
jgi:uncharacterized protein